MVSLNTNSHNQIAMQGKHRVRHNHKPADSCEIKQAPKLERRPIDDILFDRPVQNAAEFAAVAGKFGFITGTIANFIGIKLAVADYRAQGKLFTGAEKTVKTAKEKAAKSLGERVKELLTKVKATKLADVKKAVVEFAQSSKPKEIANKVLENVAEGAASLVGGALTSVKYALVAGTAFLGIAAVAKFAENQARINERLKAEE